MSGAPLNVELTGALSTLAWPSSLLQVTVCTLCATPNRTRAAAKASSVKRRRQNDDNASPQTVLRWRFPCRVGIAASLRVVHIFSTITDKDENERPVGPEMGTIEAGRHVVEEKESTHGK